MNITDDYTALLLFEERAARLRGDAARDRVVGTVAREGKPSRHRWGPRRRRLSQAAPIIPLQRRPGDLRAAAGESEETARESVDRSAAS